MKIIRYQDANGRVHLGAEQTGGEVLRIEGDLFGEYRVTYERAQVRKVLAPVDAKQIICIGLNYRKHAEETGATAPEYPVIFFKSLNALQNPGDPILIPTHLASEQVDYECELAVVIGKTARNVSRENALDYVLGYTCANDVSARDWQIKRGGGQWCRGKMFDTFAPLGPRLVTADEIPNPNNLAISTTLNGEKVQDWTTSDMIFDVPALIEFLSGSTTLIPGTVILTGTPHGVGMGMRPQRWLKPGDTVTIEIESIGALENPVEAEPAS
jgi:2-keto-4-pentenoate hydratase/2-oxohepta-3-ene-1,7-dioic acid hydratase in catechol pathway